MTMTEQQRDLSISLFKAGVFRVGTFYTKTGTVLNAYFDLLSIVAHPSLMKKISDYTAQFCERENINCDSVCGVTYGGIPFATLLAMKLQKPLLMGIKEISDSPQECKILGNALKKKNCLIVEEVTASGRSVLEIIKNIEDTGVHVKNVFTIIELGQGAQENLKKLGYELHSLLTISQLVHILCEEKFLTDDRQHEILQGFSLKLALNGDSITNTKLGIKKLMQYEERVDLCKSKAAQKLFKIMVKKKSNLCIDFENPKMNVILQIAELIGPFICVLSLHLDTLDDFEESDLRNLRKIAEIHEFLIMDNRKFAEDENIIKDQCLKAFKNADLLSVHVIYGESSIRSVKSVIDQFPDKGIFVFAHLNISDALVGFNYEKEAIHSTLNSFEKVTGFVCHKNSDIPLGYVHMMSDVRNNGSIITNTNKKFYSSEFIISDICADVVLLQHNDVNTIEKYTKKKRSILWDAYINRISSR